MGFIGGGTSYGMRGGTDALARREKQFLAMQTLARQHAMLPEDAEAPDPTGFKGLFFKAVDLISRPNYAIAGFVDTLAGQGREGEHAFSRAFREMFSGVAGLEGDKEMFGQVLEQMGVGKGVELSDLIGENGLTKRFNPSSRGAVGLALDIFTDPLTYISAPIRNAARVVGVGGEIKYLSAAGNEAVQVAYAKQVDGWRKYLNMADDVPDVVVLDRLRGVPKFMREQSEMSQALMQSGVVMDGGRTVHGFGIGAVSDVLREGAAKEALAEGGEALIERAGLRFRIPATGIDLPVGVDKAAVAGARRLGGFMKTGMTKSDIGEALYTHGSLVVDDVVKLFQRHSLKLRPNKAYLALENRRFRMVNAASHVAGQEADALMSGVSKAQLADRELWTQFVRAVEDPLEEQAAKFVGMAKAKGIEDAENLLSRWRETFDRVGSVDASAALIDGAAFSAWRGRYFPRLLTNLKEDVVSKLRKGDDTIRADLGQFKEGRVYDTWDDFTEGVVGAGGKEADLIVNPREVAHARLTAHYETLINQQFLSDVSQRFGFMGNEHVAKIAKALSAEDRVLNPVEAANVKTLSELDDVFTGIKTDADASYKLFKGLSKPARAAYLSSSLERMNTLEEFGEFVSKYGDDISEMGDLSKTVDAMYDAKQVVLRDTFGQPFKTATFAGRKMSLPAAVIDDIAEFEKRFDPTPEMNRLLSNYDAMTNWWKISVTRWFPNFWNRNLYSNVAQMHMDIGLAALNPLYGWRAFQIMRGADGTLPVRGGQRLTNAAFRNEMDSMGVRVDRGLVAELTGKQAGDPVEWFAEKRLRAGGIDEPFWKGVEKGFVGIGNIENHARVMHAMVLRQRGFGPQDVAFQTNKFLVDYSDLAAAEKGVFRRLFPFWVWCVPEEAEILTYNGWKTWDQLSECERVLSYNVEKDVLEPDSVKEVAVFDYDGPLAHIKGKRLDVLCTHDHSWAVTTKAAKKATSGKVYPAKRSVQKYRDINTSQYIVLSAPKVDEGSSTLSVEDARLFGWLLTDGYWRWKGNSLEAVIYQTPKKFLDEVIEVAGGKPRAPHPETGCVCVPVPTRRLDGLREWLRREKRGEGWADLVVGLSCEAAEAMYDAVYKADGTVSENRKGDYLACRKRGLINTFEALCVVLGKKTTRTKRGFYISKKRHGKPQKAEDQHYVGRVWCPTTTNGTWVMRYNGFVTITGNTKKTSIQQVRNLYERPGRMAQHAKLFMQDRGPDGDHLPEYLRGQMSARIEGGPDGEHWLTGIDLPFGSMKVLWNGSLGKTFREQIGMLTPFIKVPLEAGVGQDFFSGRPSRGVGEIQRRLGASMARNMPQPMQDWFELENIGTDEKPRYAANRLKIHLVMKGMFLSRFVSQGVRIDELAGEVGKGDINSGLTTMMKLLVGLDLRSVDLEEKDRQTLFNRARRLEEMLINRGLMREFTRPFIPKDKKVEQSAQPVFASAGG